MNVGKCIMNALQRSHFCRVEIQSGTFLGQGTESTRTDSEQIEQRERDTGNRLAKIGGLAIRTEPSE